MSVRPLLVAALTLTALAAPAPAAFANCHSDLCSTLPCEGPVCEKVHALLHSGGSGH